MEWREDEGRGQRKWREDEGRGQREGRGGVAGSGGRKSEGVK